MFEKQAGWICPAKKKTATLGCLLILRSADETWEQKPTFGAAELVGKDKAAAQGGTV